ncbi:MAG: efflux RND transporter permease subunit, partial [Gammaproteobacteria bacterium]
MHAFEAAYARWIVNHRAIAIILPLLLVAAAAAGLPKLYFDSSYRVFFGKDNPQLIAYENVENTYTKIDNVVIVLAPKNGDVFTPDNLAAIEELTTASWQIPYSSRVDSITNFQYTYAEDDDLIVRDMVKDGAALDAESIAAVRAAVLAEPALHKRLVSDTGHVTGINVTMQLPAEERTTATPIIVGHVREMVADFEARHPNFDTYLTGMVMMDNAFNESAMYDSTFLVPIAFVLMMALLALLAGGFTGTFVTMGVIILSIAAALGAGGHVGYPMTSVTASAPIIILTVAVANAVHVLVTFAHGMHLGESKREAMQESLRINLQPVSLASITTAIGFTTMNFS